MEFVPVLRNQKGSFEFLHPNETEVRQLLEDMELALPRLQPVFLEGEKPSPLRGFLLVESAKLQQLEGNLEQALGAALDRLLAERRGESSADAAYAEAWTAYLELLERATENVTASNYGRRYPTIFWLYHSIVVARTLARAGSRLLKAEPRLGEQAAAQIILAAYDQWARRVDHGLRALERRLSDGETDEALYPPVFSRMRENPLVFCRETIDRDLVSLDGYLRAHLGVDGLDFRRRWHRLRLWHREVVGKEPLLGQQARFLSGLLDANDPERLLTTPGYVSYLRATASAYEPRRLWNDRQVEIWEKLLPRLKTWELVANLRRLILRVRWVGSRLVCPAAEAQRLGMGADDLQLAPSLRPLDFLSPWVVDPGVSRGGLVYDIIDFTHTVSRLEEAPPEEQEEAFRSFFKLQKRLDRIATHHRLYQEKYLGDGTVYTGRDSRRLVVAAIRMQRAYREALGGDFPFCQGMRIALNHGDYRLLPLGGTDAHGGTRYEIFGESVVELFRLVSGKSSQQLDELASTLVARGYTERKVEEFLAPLRDDESGQESPRSFEVRLGGGGRLLNRGIVATQSFVRELEAAARFESLWRSDDGEQSFVLGAVEDSGVSLEIGMRRLGRADLKGLGHPVVYELVDGDLVEGARMRLDTVVLEEALAQVAQALTPSRGAW